MVRHLLVLALAGAAAGAACDAPKVRQLDHDLIRVSTDAELRTDTIGDGKWAAPATFVLVDAENTAKQGAYVTLSGELDDAGGHKVDDLRAQSLWIPAGEQRTFALVDRTHAPAPAAAAAKIFVRGAEVPVSPPLPTVDSQREVEDYGKIVAQGVLHNPAKLPGVIMVIASFHDAGGKPLTRPFALVRLGPGESQPVQFVGPPGSKHGTIFVGETVY